MKNAFMITKTKLRATGGKPGALRALAMAGVLATAGLATAEEVNFEGGTLVVPVSGTVSIATENPQAHNYSYTDPATGLAVDKQISLGGKVIPYMPVSLN
ncbi:MAG: hypothetical protein LBM92_03530, partial [Opitutaceae bacterium]|nr:hypothetical protein [Opitutaceae bacterium]